MGLSDRDYYRDDQAGGRFVADWSAITTLIVINVAVLLVELFTTDGPSSWIEQNLALQPDLFHHPWNCWQLLTYGFVHDSHQYGHILFNMIGLWIFGSEVEGVYGKREFYKLYISLIILAGLVSVALQNATAQPSSVVGASGGVMGVAVIFACHFPRRTMLLFPLPIPIPAFLLVGLFILMDLLGTQDHQGNVAHWAHLGGAAFGFVYYKTGWSLFRLWPRRLNRTVTWGTGPLGKRSLGKFSWPKMPWNKPKFRIHREPEEEEEAPADDYLSTSRLQQRVDQLLEKISRSGESSLTDDERQFLSDASRRYQQQRRR
jgi:membrane associated rhomboid family serine protease